MNHRRLLSAEAVGKHLFHKWEGGKIVHIHLGLYGRFRNHKTPLPQPRGQVRVRVAGAERGFDLHGPNRCELITNAQFGLILDRLGPDPLRKDSDPELAWDRIRRSRAAIGSLLLNQSVLAGVGNVYRAEILYALNIHPDRAGRLVGREEFDRLWKQLSDWLKIGVRYNRIITTDAKQLGKTPSRLLKDERLMIYKKDECAKCGNQVESWLCGARKIYACPGCQSS